MSDLTDPQLLRAHMALCLLGFRGLGYSPEFVERMTTIQADLRADPARPLRLVDHPDQICIACPHLVDGGCTLAGPDHETHMRAHDREVLRRLGLEAGAVLTWAEIQDRIAKSVRGADLPAICTTCPWLPMGACADSVDALREHDTPPEAPADA